MKIFVTAKPGARHTKVERIDETHFRVAVKAPPAGGKANEAVIRALSEFLAIPKSAIVLRSGAASRSKVFDLNP